MQSSSSGQNLLKHEILPEHKCFSGSGGKLLLSGFFILGNMVVMPTVTEQQAAATASDKSPFVSYSFPGRLLLDYRLFEAAAKSH